MLAAIGCGTRRDAIDAAAEVDVGLDARESAAIDASMDAALAPDASPLDAPYPAIDCDDPALWAGEPAIEGPIPSLAAFSACDDDLLSLVLPVRVEGWGHGDVCVRVHASDLAELPTGTTAVPTRGATIGVTAPSAIDLEVRGYVPGAASGWVLASQRGRFEDPARLLRVVVPPANDLGVDVLAVLGPAVLTTTAIVDRETGNRRAHGPLLAWGLIGTRPAWVRDETPPVVEMIETDLTTSLERSLTGPIDRTRFVVLTFGVLSGSRLDMFGPLDGPLMRTLPAEMDDAVSAGIHAIARADDQGWDLALDGTATRGPSGVAQLVGGGVFLAADRRVVGPRGPIGEPIDDAIGEVIAIVEDARLAYVVGETGLALRPYDDDVFLGARTRLFDPAVDGVVTQAIERGIVLRRPDGQFVTYAFPDLDATCPHD